MLDQPKKLPQSVMTKLAAASHANHSNKNTLLTLSGQTGRALVWHTGGRVFDCYL